jgi:hypothetical protein
MRSIWSSGIASNDDLDAGLPRQQRGEAVGAAARDLLPVDHRDVGDEVGDRLRASRRGDHDGVERRGLDRGGLRERAGTEARRQQGKRERRGRETSLAA